MLQLCKLCFFIVMYACTWGFMLFMLNLMVEISAFEYVVFCRLQICQRVRSASQASMKDSICARLR